MQISLADKAVVTAGQSDPPILLRSKCQAASLHVVRQVCGPRGSAVGDGVFLYCGLYKVRSQS